jgi:hypothetical protein
MIVNIQSRKSLFFMLYSHYSFTGRPLFFLPEVNTFLLIVSYLILLLCSPSSWAVTVTSGPTLTLNPNGLTPLAAVIDLKTNLPARATLEFNDGNESRIIEFAEYKTDFSLPLLGLKPDKTYKIQVTLTEQNNQQLILIPPLQLKTDPLPNDFPNFMLFVSNPPLMEPGYTLMAKFVRETIDRKITLGTIGSVVKETLWDWMCWATDWEPFFCSDRNAPTYTIIFDNMGDVVWYSTLGGSINFQLEDGTLAYWTTDDLVRIDLLGNEIQRVKFDDPGSGLSHDIFPTVDQTYLSITRQQVNVKNFPSSYTDPVAQKITAQVEDNPIVEFDSKGNSLHIWPLVGMLDPTRIGYLSLALRSLGHDWAHVNSVVHDPHDDSIVISVRHQDAVVKFSRSTGELKWILGPHANWSADFRKYLLTPIGEPFEWQYHQHAAEITPTGTILLFDNGNYRASPFDGKAKTQNWRNYSRAVEYAIDEKNMEVRQVWEYGKNIAKPIYAHHVGDVSWMKTTGNVLITSGGTSYTGGVPHFKLGIGSNSTRVIEVTHDTPPEKVFDLLVYDPGRNAKIQVYRSERLPDLYPLDTDADGVPDYKDNCIMEQNGPLFPGNAFTSQLDTDGDGAGDICDNDDDNDGIADNYGLETQLDPLDHADANLGGDKDG